MGGPMFGDEPPKPLGQVAYEAYCDDRNWESFNGTPLPQWDDQAPELQTAWEAAAQVVVNARDDL